MKSPSNTEKQLKHAVEQQLDLILKIQEDRKILKRQNKSLNEKYLKLTETIKKYSSVSRIDQSTFTEMQEVDSHCAKEEIKVNVQTIDRACQVDLLNQQENFNTMNNSKLNEARSFLKGLDSSLQSANNTSKLAEQKIMLSYTSHLMQNQTLRRVSQQTSTGQDKTKQKTSQISSQLVKLSKQMASLKRQLKDSQNKSKIRQKQFKQLKKCLDTKNQALQKCRKEFNQLSLLLNTDKYKSVRILQTENQRLKQKASKIDEQNEVIQNLKQILESITNEYSSYKNQKEKKISSLIRDLKQKDQQRDELQIQVGQFRNELNIIKF